MRKGWNNLLRNSDFWMTVYMPYAKQWLATMRNCAWMDWVMLVTERMWHSRRCSVVKNLLQATASACKKSRALECREVRSAHFSFWKGDTIHNQRGCVHRLHNLKSSATLTKLKIAWNCQGIDYSKRTHTERFSSRSPRSETNNERILNSFVLL